jgi:nucleotide-binding universal stress UspA family protein
MPIMRFHKILCPVDFSPESRRAMELAAELARDSHAALVVAHVWSPPHWVAGGDLAPEYLERAIDADEAELAEWKHHAEELGATDVATKLLTGSPWDQILTAATEDRAIDLIVMGTHGRTGLSHVLLGSVAEKVMRHAPCPVLVSPSH